MAPKLRNMNQVKQKKQINFTEAIPLCDTSVCVCVCVCLCVCVYIYIYIYIYIYLHLRHTQQ
jgi:hypothetical protein